MYGEHKATPVGLNFIIQGNRRTTESEHLLFSGTTSRLRECRRGRDSEPTQRRSQENVTRFPPHGPSLLHNRNNLRVGKQILLGLGGNHHALSPFESYFFSFFTKEREFWPALQTAYSGTTLPFMILFNYLRCHQPPVKCLLQQTSVAAPVEPGRVTFPQE